MNSCVIGLQWGDEGKGKIVDILAERSDIVVRYSGGANAGHTVVVGDSRFALHLLPSGSVRPNIICVIANAVVVDPETLLKEIDELAKKNITLNDRLFISEMLTSSWIITKKKTNYAKNHSAKTNSAQPSEALALVTQTRLAEATSSVWAI